MHLFEPSRRLRRLRVHAALTVSIALRSQPSRKLIDYYGIMVLFFIYSVKFYSFYENFTIFCEGFEHAIVAQPQSKYSKP